MLALTKRDRIFAAAALPLALAVGYAHFVRAPLARDVSAVRARCAALGPAAALEAERPALQRRRAEAARRLREADEAAAAAAAARPAAAAPGDVSERLRRVVEALGAVEGVRLVATEDLAGRAAAATDSWEDPAGPPRRDADAPPLVALVRDALGIERPERRRFVLSADYAAVLRALAALRERDVPAVVESAVLDGEGAGTGGARRWTLDIVL